MTEARIECLVKEFPLHDLKLHMRKGDVEWKPEADARKSRELAEAVRIGAIAVRYVERCQVAKSPPQPKRHVPPSVRLSRPNMGGMVRQPPTPATGDPQMDKKLVKEAVREELRDALAGQETPTVNKDMLKDALREVLAEGGFRGPPTTYNGKEPVAIPSDPMYIPTDLVKKDAKADITAQKDESAGGDLDAAAAALKATKTKRRRTQKAEE